MKFTHELDGDEGWKISTSKQAEYFKKVEHLGKCDIDGDMFVAYDEYNFIYIFKGTMEEETLKTNTWYKNKGLGFFVCRTGNENNYSIDIYGNEDFCFPCSDFNLWTEATDEEIEEPLIKLAKKKGFENVHELTLKDFDGEIINKGTFECLGNNYIYNDGKLFLDGVPIFKNGVWVEIVEDDELSIEERLKRIEEKLNI